MSNSKETTLKTAENPKVKSNSLPLLLAFVAGAALLTSFYTLRSNQSLQGQLEGARSDFRSQIHQLKQDQSQTQEQINAKAQALQHNQKQLKEELQSIRNQVDSSLNQTRYKTKDWVLLKARYYLELAQINAYWTKDFKTSIAQLQAADNLLNEMNQTGMYDLRQKIAQEIVLLKTIPIEDIPGLLSQLSALQIGVDTLHLQANLEKGPSKTTTESTATADSEQWQLPIEKSMKMLEKLVVIRREKEDVQPLMSPVFEAAVKEALRLNLQEAQWALLNNNPEAYQLALRQAILNLKRISSQGEGAVRTIIDQLSQLQNIKLQDQKPEIGQALATLNVLIEQKNPRLNPQAPDQEGEKQP